MAKKAKPKRQKAQPSVLGNLPAQRPQRLGGRREPAGKRAAAAPEAGVRTRPVPTPSAKTRATAAAAPSPPARPRPVASAPPPRPESRRGPPRGTELVTTAVQAAGELAQIGLTAGGRALKRAVDRIPRP
jgi:hypothetical protein